MPVTLATKTGRWWGQDQPGLYGKTVFQRKRNHSESSRELLTQQELRELGFLHVRGGSEKGTGFRHGRLPLSSKEFAEGRETKSLEQNSVQHQKDGFYGGRKKQAEVWVETEMGNVLSTWGFPSPACEFNPEIICGRSYWLPYTRPCIPKDAVPYQGTHFVVKGGKVIRHLLFLSRVHGLKAAGFIQQCYELQKTGSLQLRDNTSSG